MSRHFLTLLPVTPGYGEISEDLASIVQVKGEVSLGYGHGMEAEKRDRIERTQNP